MKILVTGGAGFIGSHIVDEYISMGYDVTVVDNLSSGNQHFLNPKAKFEKMDICCDKIQELIGDEKFDIINHQAAQVNKEYSSENPIEDARINIIGSINLLQSAVKHKVEKIIVASDSSAIYGEQYYFPAHENHQKRPVVPAGISQYTVERYLSYYWNNFRLKSISFRYANVYGPRQKYDSNKGAIAIFCKKILAGEDVVVYGTGKQTRDFIFVEDVVSANVQAVTSSFNHEVLNIGTAIETSINDIISIIKEKANSDISIINEPSELYDEVRTCLDIKEAKAVLKWEPLCDLDEGIDLTVDYFKSLDNK